MEAEVKIKASMQMVENNIEAQARKQGQKAGRAFQDGAKKTGKGGIFDMLKSNGGVLNGLKGVLTGGGIKSLLNPSMLLKAISGPIGVAMTGVSLAFLAIQKKFESQEKAFNRQVTLTVQKISDQQNALKNSEDKSMKTLAILEKLKEYSNKSKSGQVLSDEEIKNASLLINELKNEYGSLNVTVDTLGRSIEGFDDSLLGKFKSSALNNKIKQLQSLNQEYNQLLALSSTKAMQGLPIGTWNFIESNFDKENRDYFGNYEYHPDLPSLKFQELLGYKPRNHYDLWEANKEAMSDKYSWQWNEFLKGIGNLQVFTPDWWKRKHEDLWQEDYRKRINEKRTGLKDLKNPSFKDWQEEAAFEDRKDFLKFMFQIPTDVFGFWGDYVKPYSKRFSDWTGLTARLGYKTEKQKWSELFDLKGLNQNDRINKINELIKKFTDLRNEAEDEQKVKSFQQIIENLKKRLNYEKQINKAMDQRKNLQKQLDKQSIMMANLEKSAEWKKQEQIEQKINQFNKQQQFNSLDTDSGKRRYYNNQLSNLEAKRNSLTDLNKNLSSKTYSDESEKIENEENLILLQEMFDDFMSGKGERYQKLKKGWSESLDLKAPTDFEYIKAVLENWKKERQNVKENMQAVNLIYPLIRSIDPNLSREEKDKKLKENWKKEIQERKDKIFKYDAERAKDSAQIAKNETQIKKIMLQELKIKKQMEELDKRRQEYFGSLVRNNDWEEEKFRAQVKGDWDSYLGDEVQIQDNNSKMNMTMDEKLSWMQQKRRERNLNVRRMIKGQAESMYDSMLPNTYENDVERTVRELEKANKITLQPDMVDKIRQLLKIKWDKQDAENYFNSIRGELNIKTNSLTARGGFAGGAYVPKLGDYQQNAVALQRQTNTNLVQIKQLIRDLGKI